MKSGMRSEKGFTLVEMAMVLVIIGIIMAAVVKGQDIIENARHKRLAAAVKQWEVMVWSYYDRYGCFPGTVSGNTTDCAGGTGSILFDPQTTLQGQTDLAGVPETNVLQLGSYVWYLYLGNASDGYNFIAACPSADCVTQDDTSGAYNFFSVVDRAIDGVTAPVSGSVRALSGATLAANSGWFIGVGGNAAVDSVANIAGVNGLSAASSWKGAQGMLYFFDRRLP